MKKTTEQEDNLKLIYVLKVGYNSKHEGLYEFIFSKDETNIDADLWRWDMVPACDYAQPPETDYVDKVISLKTKKFNLYCLHEAVDREYMHGYHTIHALAYEKADDDQDGYVSYEDIYDNDQSIATNGVLRQVVYDSENLRFWFATGEVPVPSQPFDCFSLGELLQLPDAMPCEPDVYW